MVEIEIVDTGAGNVGSVGRCLQRLEIAYRFATVDSPPTGNRPLILPGVGNFGAVMSALTQANLRQRIIDLVRAGTPYLGICVGMQILFDGSEESAGVKGLGLLPGQVVRFCHRKVPQIGWNKVIPRQRHWDEGFAYFVNSFYPAPADERVVLYHGDYGGQFCAAVRRDNVTGFQFHPEKSGAFGENLLSNWVSHVS